jgi:enterobactin synthetase component D
MARGRRQRIGFWRYGDRVEVGAAMASASTVGSIILPGLRLTRGRQSAFRGGCTARYIRAAPHGAATWSELELREAVGYCVQWVARRQAFWRYASEWWPHRTSGRTSRTLMREGPCWTWRRAGWRVQWRVVMADGGAGGELTSEAVRRGLPSAVGVALRFIGSFDNKIPGLYPVEEEALGPRAVPQRRRLFAIGRAAARDALRELGVDDVAIPRAPGGEPVWPDGYVGSISHSHEVALALVGQRCHYVGLGVDVEELARGPSARAARLVCRPSEMEWVDVASGTERLARLFSAKEAVFKALYPIEHVWLGFADAELRWEADREQFEARVLKSVGHGYPEGFRLRVNSTIGTRWVLSTAFVPADSD